MRETKLGGVYESVKGKKRVILTKSLDPGFAVYDERTVKEKGAEYREWNPRKSKLAAAIMKGASQIGIMPGKRVLYLGCASGTTASHVSDIVGQDGFVFALDFAPRVMREMVFLCERRKNMMPIVADANDIMSFSHCVCKVDVVFQDIAQREQLSIFLKNCRAFLKNGGFGLLAVKARSIDVARKPRAIFNEIKVKLEKEMIIADFRGLEPFEADHCIFICKKK